MWAIVKASKVIQLVSSPKAVVINDTAHPKEIFIYWKKDQLKKNRCLPIYFKFTTRYKI